MGVPLFTPDTFRPGARIAFQLFGRQYNVMLKSVRLGSRSLSLGEFLNPLRFR